MADTIIKENNTTNEVEISLDKYMKLIDQLDEQEDKIKEMQEEAKKAIAGGSQLEDVVNVPARTDLMRGRFEKGYDGKIEELISEMNKQISASMEAN